MKNYLKTVMLGCVVAIGTLLSSCGTEDEDHDFIQDLGYIYEYDKSGQNGIGSEVVTYIGFWQWRRRGAKVVSGEGEDSRVKARRLSGKQWAWLAAGILAGIAALYFILLEVDLAALRAGRIDSVNKSKVLLDSVVMTLNIAGQVLLSFAFMEQWYIWILVNISSISLWAVALLGGTGSGNAAVMLIKYIFYLMNSLNGLRIWLGLSKRVASPDLDNC